MSIVALSGRFRRITSADNGNQLELSTGAADAQVGAWTIQFNPSVNWNGSITIQGRVSGVAGVSANPPAPLSGIAYKRISQAGTGTLRELITDPITQACIIEVPSNQLTVALAVTTDAGYCDVFSNDMAGPST